MKLPNGEHAIVEIEKLRTYCLNPHHPRGRHKARVFASVGILQRDAEMLRDALIKAAHQSEAVPGAPSPYGERYIVDLQVHCSGTTVIVRSAWIVRHGEDKPRLTTCYVL